MAGRVLDVTRTLARAHHVTPGAIDRIERAWAEHLMADPEARFLVTGAEFHALLDGAGAREVFSALESGAELPPADLRGAFSRWRSDRQRRADSLVRRIAVAQAESLAGLLAATPGAKSYLNVAQAHFDAARLKALREGGATQAAVMIHDLTPLTHPEFTRPAAPTRALGFLAAASLADAVIFTSADAARTAPQFIEHAPPALIAPPGLTPLGPREGETAAGGGFVMLGAIEPQRDHAGMLWIWRRLHDELGDSAPHLHLIGRRGAGAEAAADMLDRGPMTGRCVFAHRGLRDAEVAALLRGARALLVPSFVESIGQTTAEALALGTPVIAADLPVLRAVGGSAPEYLDPLDLPAWLETVLAYAAADDPRRGAQLARIAAWSPPRWDEHFSAVERFLDAPPAA